jgi:aspartate/methionine/tyrosine aminotransferase
MLKDLFKKKPSDEYQDLTQHEIQALKYQYNLADAHTHQSQSPSQKKIVARLPKLWYEAEQKSQYEMEQRFIETFFRTQNQDYALKPNNGLLVYAASIAMVIMANYLMKKKMTVALMHPCFDNLHDILRNMQITPKPLQEEWFYDPDKIYDNLKKNVKEDVIFLVDPNNPTGFTLGGEKPCYSVKLLLWSSIIDSVKRFVLWQSSMAKKFYWNRFDTRKDMKLFLCRALPGTLFP